MSVRVSFAVSVLIALATITPVTPAQVTHDVPGSFATIQAAINFASPGDTVRIAPGVYAEQLVITKAVRITGSGGPDLTHVVGGGSGPVIGVTAQNSLTPLDVILEGITIRDGIESGLTLFGVMVTSAVVRDCVIRNNRGGDGAPGATELGGAGGVSFGALSQGELILERCRITDNIGGNGSVATPAGSVCGVAGNGGAGGLSVVFGGAASLTNCLVARNTGGNGGDSTCTSAPGSAGNGGHGAIDRVPSLATPNRITLLNTCIIANLPGSPGTGAAGTGATGVGGIGDVTGPITNSILVGNTGGAFSPGNQQTVAFSNVEGGTTGPGNIDLDPQFVDAAGDDFHIATTSPCIDAGHPFGLGLPPSDFDGDLRLIGAAVDMGLDEAAVILYPGTAEDFILESFVLTKPGDQDFPVKSVNPGDVLGLHFLSPNGAFDFTIPFLLGQAFPTGAPHPSPFPGIQMNATATPAPVVLFDGTLQGGLTGFVLPPGGLTFLAPIPPHFTTGLSIMFQAFVVNGPHANAIFTSTDAHESRTE